MVAGPQIITSFFLATSEKWAKASSAFIGGSAIAITTVVTIAYFVGRGSKSAAGSSHSSTLDHVLDGVVLALLVFLAVRVFLKRHETEPPKWMTSLQKERPKGAFILGLALLSVFPTDIASNIAVGFHLARHGAPWWQCLPFVGLTLLLLAIPSLIVVMLGRRASDVLPEIRDSMSQNSWIVSEIVIVFVAAIEINSLVSS